MQKYWLSVLCSSIAARSATAADADGFDYPFGPPNGLPRCPGSAQCSGGWQNVQDFRVNNHLGEDWNLGFGSDDLGTPVFAAANGEVVYAQDVGGDGSWRGVIIIRHTGTEFRVPGAGTVQQVKSMYGHLDPAKINQWVAVGDQVARGQQIGVIGPTPVGSTGPHLHFEVRTDLSIGVGPGYGTNPAGWIDPSDFIDANRPVVGQPSDLALTIGQAVGLSWLSKANKSYKVYGSPDMLVWEFLGGPVESTVRPPQFFYPVAWGDKKFFRIEEGPSRLLSWLDGGWQGSVYQAGSGAQAFTVRVSASSVDRSFTAALFDSSTGNPGCTATLSLVSSAETQARFNWVTVTGDCKDGPVVLTRVNSTNILYTWYSQDGPTVASSSGTLVKRP